MKKLLFSLLPFLVISLHVSAQISTITQANGSVTITPSGLQSKFTKGSNANSNIGLGDGALKNNFFGTDIIAIGANASPSTSSATSTFQVRNIAIGTNALSNIQPTQNGEYADNGKDNIAIGYNAVSSNMSGNYNVGIGTGALSFTTGSANNAFGTYALTTNTTGNDNSAFGYFALYSNNKGQLNSAFGNYAMQQNTNANYNTAIGNRALTSQNFSNGGTPYPTHNVAIGYNSLASNNPTDVTNGINNTAVGSHALTLNKSGRNNTAMGTNALYSNTYSHRNVAIGNDALYAQAYANANVAYETANVAIGSEALKSTNPTSTGNGNYNVAVGSDALENNTIGGKNVALGSQALQLNSTGTYNTAIGYLALATNETGGDNVAIGDYACASCKGNANIAIGNGAGNAETGGNKLYIENSSSASPLIGGNFSTDVVGINMPITSLASNTGWKLQVGGDINATGSVRAAGVVLSSDKRFKKNILSIESPLQKLLQLNGVTYHWRAEEFADRGFTNKKQIGLIAQEVEKVFPDLVDTDAQGYKSVNYVQLTPLMIEAIKELKKENDLLRKENEASRKETKTLTSRLDKIEALLNTQSEVTNNVRTK